MREIYRFDNQICLVTGAGSESGIGFATAKILGRQGGQVIITGTTERIFDREQELRAEGITARGYIVDLMDQHSVRKLIDLISRDIGDIDVLVNNAGMTQVGQAEKLTLFCDLEDGEFEESISRNLMTTYYTTREVIKGMIKKCYGRIVNVSSTTGPIGSNIGETGYGAAKAAMLGMSKGIALEVAKYKITVNNVLPGWIGTGSQTQKEALAGRYTPIGRSGSPDEVAHMIVFLSTKEASYITGQDFVVDGGNCIIEDKGSSIS